MRIRAIVISALCCLPLCAQQQDETSSYFSAPWAGSQAYMRKTFGRLDTRVVLKEPVRLRDFVVDGKLELSLKSYLELVMSNNTDIEIQRVQLELPKNAIQRAFSVFDPTVISSFAATRTNTPTSNTLEGATILSNLNQPFNSRFQQTLPTGTQVFSTLNWSKVSNNNTFQLFNPNYQNTWQMGFTQPLLRNRGSYITRLPITIARSQRRATLYTFEDTIQRLLVTAENAYWDVVSARERLKVQEQALDLADKALQRARRELELGAASPLEIFQPEQQYATAKINLTQVQFQLQIAEEVLRRQVAVDLDAELRKLPVVLTERVETTPDERVLDKEKLVETALAKRPDLKATVQNLDVNELQIQTSRNALRPLLNLNSFYQTFGRGGPSYTAARGGQPALFIPGGAGDAWSQMFGFNFNTYNFALQMTLPLRDRRAAADLADSLVNKKVNTLRQRTLEQQIRQDVVTAINNVELSKASVNLAKIALDYAVKRAEADQKRYDLGVINIFFLLDAQNALTNAQSNLVNQTVTYRRNMLNLLQRTGTLLDEKGIVLQ